MKRASTLVFAVLLAGIAWLVWRDRGELPRQDPPAQGAADATAAVPDPLASQVGPETSTASPAPTLVREQVEPARAPEVPTVTLRGRCVDAATSAPVAGCEVKVHGWPANSERMDAYLKNHEKVDWEKLSPQTTGADGTFSFTFVPPPPYQFTLDIHAPGAASIHGRWSSLEPGTVKDFGDVALQSGSMVSGRIADSAGVPQDKVEVYIGQNDRRPARGGLEPHYYYNTASRADGTFAFPRPISFGTWNVKVNGRQKIAPASLEIPAGQAVTTLDIETRPVGEVQTITGVVVDDNGAPARRVNVNYEPSLARSFSVPSTERDGSFTVERREGDPDGPVRLQLDGEGFERLVSEEPHPWGTKNLKLVIRRGLTVSLAVTDGETGTPIEEYGVRCFPTPGTRQGMGSGDIEVRARGHHPGGKATIEGITRGHNLLVVEPTGDAWETSDLVSFEVTDVGAPEQRIELFRAVSRTLRVQRASGDPVAGTEVELLRPFETPVTLTTRALELRHLWGYSAPDKAIAVMQGRTAANGELELRGPQRSALALRILGPGHVPLVEQGVTLAAGAAPLVITVPTGATVIGRIEPPDVVQWFPPMAETLARAHADNTTRQLRDRHRPGLMFSRTRDGKPESYPASSPTEKLPLRDDGTFEVVGVPPGTWHVHLGFTIDLGGGSSTSSSELLATLTDLAEGEVRKLEADLRHLLPARITGVVLLNGVPLEGATLQANGTKPDGRGGEQPISGTNARLGPGGAFALQLTPATYRLDVLRQYDRGRWIHLPVTSRLALQPGQELHEVYHVSAGALRVRLQGSNGKPLPGVQVQVASLDGSWRTQTPATDKDGCAALEAALPGTLVLAVVPKRLTDPEAQRAFWQANQSNPNAWDEAMVPVGRVEVVAGQPPDEVEITLPASAGY